MSTQRFRVVAEATGVAERYEKTVQVDDVLVLPSAHTSPAGLQYAADLYYVSLDGSPCNAVIEQAALDYLVAHGLKWLPA